MRIDDLIARTRRECEINRSMRDRFFESGDQDYFDGEAGLRCDRDAKVFEEIAGALEELKSYRASIFSGDMTKRMLKEERQKTISEFAKKVGEILSKNSFRMYGGEGDYDVVTVDDAMDAMLIVEAEMNNDESGEGNESNIIHEIKILPKYYDMVISNIKHFELRKDDRDYEVGDFLVLKEYDGSVYTGRETEVKIENILRDCPEYGLLAGYCILGW